jgi:Raf kinase inhibitor-like YbhB/YbcL family protein
MNEFSLLTILVMVIMLAANGSKNKFSISSSAFEDGKSIPTKYASTYIPGGKNVSLPLSWSNAPAETKSFALSIVDLHPIANKWVHWLVINIPKSTSSLAESASTKQMPSGSKELYNSFGERGYGGPGPPKGSGMHTYEITLYALAVEKLDLSENSSLKAFMKAIEGKIVATAKMTGTYER